MVWMHRVSLQTGLMGEMSLIHFKKHRFWICPALALALSVTAACGSSGTKGEPADFSAFLEQTNSRHEAITAREEMDVSRLQYAYGAQERGFTQEELELLTANYGASPSKGNRITYDGAMQDVDLLFKLFKYFYAGYNLLGGDEVFNQHRQELEAELQKRSADLRVSDFEALLQKNISFVQDGHVLVNGYSPLTHQTLYTTTEVELHKDEAGFYRLDKKGKKDYLLSVNGQKRLEEWVKRSVNVQGQMVYYAGVLAAETNTSLQAVLEFEGGEVSYVLRKNPLGGHPSGSSDNPEIRGSIPLVQIPTLEVIPDEQAFQEEAALLGDSKLGILDLRGNQGGTEVNVKRWLDAYKPGEYGGRLLGYLMTNYSMDATDLLLHMHEAVKAKGITRDTARIAPMLEANNFNWRMRLNSGSNSWLTDYIDQAAVEHDGILFVLTDQADMSAAELLAGKLHFQRNVVFVGTNTGGVATTTGGTPFVLPHSKISIILGNSLSTLIGSEFKEGTGLLPDLWVQGDSLEKVYKLIDYYQLEDAGVN